MKKLIIITAIIFSSVQFTNAQSNLLLPNQFTVEKTVEDGVIQLNWESYREINSSYFLIEKSIDGVNFSTVGTQKAGSSTYQKATYSYQDMEEDASVSTYRITMVTMDGSRVSNTTDVILKENVAEVMVK